MGKGTSGGQDRRYGSEKGGAGRGGAHRSDQTEPDSAPFKCLSVPGSDPDRGMDHLVRKDVCEREARTARIETAIRRLLSQQEQDVLRLAVPVLDRLSSSPD